MSTDMDEHAHTLVTAAALLVALSFIALVWWQNMVQTRRQRVSHAQRQRALRHAAEAAQAPAPAAATVDPNAADRQWLMVSLPPLTSIPEEDRP